MEKTWIKLTDEQISVVKAALISYAVYHNDRAKQTDGEIRDEWFKGARECCEIYDYISKQLG